MTKSHPTSAVESVTDIEFSPHKYLLFADKLRALASGRDVFPVTVELDSVDYCNHRCGWCVDPRHGHTALRVTVARELLRELEALDVRGIVFKGGGEPTLHEDFAELLGLASRLGFEVGVVTNGSRLNVLDEDLAEHASYVRVSIDRPTAEAHAALHGSRDFELILAGLEKLLRCRGKKRHPTVGLSFAMDHEAIDLVAAAVELGDRMGVEYVLFRTPFFEEVGRVPTMDIDQTRAVRRAFEDARREYQGPMRILIDHWISDAEAEQREVAAGQSPRRGEFLSSGANGIEHVTGRCLASPLLAVVAADRTVFPCCNLRGLDDWAIGRLDYDAGVTFRDVWEGARRQEVIAAIHRVACFRHCTHPLSKYNEAIEYLRGARHHRGFV